MIFWYYVLCFFQPVESIGSNPFVNPVPIIPSDDASAGGIDQSQDGEEESKVVSRLHLRDDQRVIKEKFEQKQREEAKKRAIEEKKAQKKVREMACRRNLWLPDRYMYCYLCIVQKCAQV